MYVFRVAFAALSLFCLSVLAIWTLSPYMVTQSITNLFAEYDAQFEIESIAINPLTGAIDGRAGRVTTKGDVGLEFESFHIQLELLPLLAHKIVVSNVSVEGLNLIIKQEDMGWRVAGLYLPDEPATLVESQKAGPSSEVGSSSWQVNLPSIKLHNSRVGLIHLVSNGSTTPVPIRDDIKIPNLAIQNILGQGANWRGNASAVLIINGARIALNTRTQIIEGKFVQWVNVGAFKAHLQQFAHYLPSNLKGSDAEIDLAGEIIIGGEAGTIRVTAITKKLRLSRVDLKLKDLTVASALTSVDLDRLQLMLNPSESPRLIFKGTLHSMDTRIQEGAGKSTLAAWDRLDIGPIQMGMDEAMKLDIGQVSFNNLKVSQVDRDGAQYPPLMFANHVRVQNINSTLTATHADLVELNNIRSEVHLDEHHRLMTLVQSQYAIEENPPSGEIKVAPGAAQAVAGDPNPSHVLAINRIKVEGESHINFMDESIAPTFKQSIVLTSLTAEGLNTGAPKQSVHVLMDVKTDKYARIKSDMRIWPMAKRPTLEAQADMSEIDLPPLSPYVADALGYDISSGQMDMQLNMKVDNGEISGASNMLLRGIDLKSANAEVGIAKDTEIISLNVAISLLKDRNGNVALDVPLSGDIDSPSFGWSGFVATIARRAMAEALSTYLIRTFVPYANLVSIVKFASDRVLKIQVDSPEYVATQIELDEQNKGFIKQFRKLLLDKKDVYVKACPVAIPQDMNLPETLRDLSKEQSDALNAFAKQRGQAFKAKILEGTDISSARILLCAPAVDSSKGAKPRIEFDIW